MIILDFPNGQQQPWTKKFLNSYFKKNQKIQRNAYYRLLNQYCSASFSCLKFLKNNKITIDTLVEWEESHFSRTVDYAPDVSFSLAHTKEEEMIVFLSQIFIKHCPDYFNSTAPDINQLSDFLNTKVTYRFSDMSNQRLNDLYKSGHYLHFRLKDSLCYSIVKKKLKRINVTIFRNLTNKNYGDFFVISWLMLPRLNNELAKLDYKTQSKSNFNALPVEMERPLDLSRLDSLNVKSNLPTTNSQLVDDILNPPLLKFSGSQKSDDSYQDLIEKMVKRNYLPSHLKNQLTINTHLNISGITSVDFPYGCDFSLIEATAQTFRNIGIKCEAYKAIASSDFIHIYRKIDELENLFDAMLRPFPLQFDLKSNPPTSNNPLADDNILNPPLLKFSTTVKPDDSYQELIEKMVKRNFLPSHLQNQLRISTTLKYSGITCVDFPYGYDFSLIEKAALKFQKIGIKCEANKAIASSDSIRIYREIDQLENLFDEIMRPSYIRF